ncbi:DUF3443 family protein [Aquella oligotrophica]|uniref:DUF3443 family protein n=1 Tax=Aquella oligotrophica TaxID=2067065 RepID=A0A2I7N5A8_9NEIS|nr:DUF3443 family protein [Aquella oligotrophica]AUR51638.1 hypothetical protein CUN60_04800 [Aquella oligotrophica]
MQKLLQLLMALTTALNLSSCNSGTSSSSPTPAPTPTASNVTTVKAGSGYNGRGINVPYITVTVCIPNTTTCQKLDYILMDTGSVGLKIDASQMNNLNLPAITQNGTGLPISVCNLYGSGYAFATANYADVYIAGEKAGNIPVQIINDSADQSGVPASCSNEGQQVIFSDTGARGIIGINPIVNIANDSNTDYVCNNGNCTPITEGIPVQYLNVNPVGYFANDNNGEIISLPAATANGNTNLIGTLTFGLNTESNNAIPGSVNSILGDPNNFIGKFTVTAQGVTYDSMFDSGTNHWLFYDTAIPTCQPDNLVYCPAAATQWQSIASSYNGSGTPIAISADIASPTGYSSIMPFWGIQSSLGSGLYGLPFYYGKTVYLGFIGSQTSMGAGPTWGFSNNN